MLTLLQAQAPANGGGMQMIFMLVIMFVIVYFFMIRPQRKRQKEIEAARNALAIGSKVITASGVHGVVKSLNEGEQFMTIEVAKGVDIRIDRNYVYADATQLQTR